MLQNIVETPQFDSLVSGLEKRICVSPPYFALRHIEFSDGLRATAVAETKPGLEMGPMSAAEIGRHAAIAGLSCLALSRPDTRRHYYLAKAARCVFLPSQAPFGTEVRFSAKTLDLAQREGSACIEAEVAGAKLAHLVIHYSILREDTFARVFSQHRRAESDQGGSYRDYGPLQHEGPGIATMHSVSEACCSGHFRDFPALPVAVLMGQLVRVASAAMTEPFRVTLANVEAQALAWASEDVRLTTTSSGTRGDERLYDCLARVGERAIGGMELGIATH